MSRKGSRLPRFGLLFALRWSLFDHGKARSRSSATPFRPSRRFSAWLGRTNRCAKLGQNAGHRPAHLLRCHRTLPRFPGTLHCLPQVASQAQLIAGTRYHPVPSLHLLRRAHPYLIPEQVLFEKAIAMLAAQKRLRYHVRTCSKGGRSSPVQRNQLSFGSRLVPRAASRCTRMTHTSVCASS